MNCKYAKTWAELLLFAFQINNANSKLRHIPWSRLGDRFPEYDPRTAPANGRVKAPNLYINVFYSDVISHVPALQVLLQCICMPSKSKHCDWWVIVTRYTYHLGSMHKDTKKAHRISQMRHPQIPQISSPEIAPIRHSTQVAHRASRRCAFYMRSASREIQWGAPKWRLASRLATGCSLLDRFRRRVSGSPSLRYISTNAKQYQCCMLLLQELFRGITPKTWVLKKNTSESTRQTNCTQFTACSTMYTWQPPKRSLSITNYRYAQKQCKPAFKHPTAQGLTSCSDFG